MGNDWSADQECCQVNRKEGSRFSTVVMEAAAEVGNRLNVGHKAKAVVLLSRAESQKWRPESLSGKMRSLVWPCKVSGSKPPVLWELRWLPVRMEDLEHVVVS